MVTNKINGKYYIGQTTQTVEKRWKQHRKTAKAKKTKNFRSPGSYFYKALRHYGLENFKVETLCECLDQEALNKSEEFLIWIFGSTKNSLGYNHKAGGAQGKLTEEAKKNIGEAAKKSVLGAIHRKALSDAQRGVPLTPEHCAALSKGSRGKPKSPEHRKKIGLAHKGRIIPPETIEKRNITKSKKRVERMVTEQIEGVPAYRDPYHLSNKLRPKTSCWGCGIVGCVGEKWGNWCFDCNVKRVEKISANLKNILETASKPLDIKTLVC